MIKVGKTDKSIQEYESCLYHDYKSKILFKYVYLGIFERESNWADIDKHFHDRLVSLPKSKYFVFNYHETEQDTRVSQEFYLLTEEFVEKMGELLREYCKTHKSVASVM